MSQEIFKTTIDKSEVDKFSAMAEEWWDPTGKFKPLHDINPIRIKYIKDQIEKFYKLSDITLLDIGCGGGLICEPMTRLGAKVTGIDASEKNIKIASLHAQNMGLEINYQARSAESFIKMTQQSPGEINSSENLRTEMTPQVTSEVEFDVVLALEIIEHVADVEMFLETISHLVKNNGIVIITTLNRTLKSFVEAIIGAEYVLRWLPIGTHDWKKFLKPSEINNFMQKHDMQMLNLVGMNYNLLKKEWYLSQKVDVNYLMTFQKKG